MRTPHKSVRAGPTADTFTKAQNNLNGNQKLPRTTPREQLLLFAINKREMYGLEILQAIEESTDGEERVTTGTLYPVLHGLEQKGLIESWWGDETPDARAGARRRYYRLSETGLAVIQQVLEHQQRLLNWGTYSNNLN